MNRRLFCKPGHFRRNVLGLTLLLLTLPAWAVLGRGRAEHVVLVVWDGMRPDFVLPQYTSNLYHLATNGVFFKNHHAVYVTSTEVNGVALATGVYPNRSGIMANSEFRPEIGWLGAFGTESLDAVRRADLLTREQYIQVPTLPELVQDAGYPTAIAGTKPVVLLHDRSGKRTTPAQRASVNLFRGMTLPRAALETVKKANDDREFPASAVYPNTPADEWTTRALVQGMWRKGLPRYSVLWLSDPDYSQHHEAPGADVALRALESADKQLGVVLKALADRKLRDKTDILVVSDHGFSTIERTVDVAALLKKAGFNAFRRFENPEPGDVLVVGLGGSVSLYVVDRDETVIRRLVEFFQTTDFAGVIFSRIPLPGTFPLTEVRIGTATTGPDVLVGMKWTLTPNAYGVAGQFVSDGGTKGKGSHASFSPADVRVMLVAAGPSFKQGYLSELPSGNIDLVPTILHLLGLKSPEPLDGRVLAEALLDSRAAIPTPRTQTVEATCTWGLFQWRQYLKYTTVGQTIYFNEAGGGAQLR